MIESFKKLEGTPCLGEKISIRKLGEETTKTSAQAAVIALKALTKNGKIFMYIHYGINVNFDHSVNLVIQETSNLELDMHVIHPFVKVTI